MNFAPLIMLKIHHFILWYVPFSSILASSFWREIQMWSKSPKRIWILKELTFICIVQYKMFKPIRLAQNAKSSVGVSFNWRKNFLKFKLLECNWLDNIRTMVKQFPNRHPFVRTSKMIWITKWMESTICMLACITLLKGKQPKICANL